MPERSNKHLKQKTQRIPARPVCLGRNQRNSHCPKSSQTERIWNVCSTEKDWNTKLCDSLYLCVSFPLLFLQIPRQTEPAPPAVSARSFCLRCISTGGSVRGISCKDAKAQRSESQVKFVTSCNVDESLLLSNLPAGMSIAFRGIKVRTRNRNPRAVSLPLRTPQSRGKLVNHRFKVRRSTDGKRKGSIFVEYLLLLTIVGIGAIAGIASVRTALHNELLDLANAINAIIPPP